MGFRAAAAAAVIASALVALEPGLAQVEAQARPRDFRVVRWTTADGLPQNTVNDILALDGGEVWLATFGGLVRFDGERFEIVDLAADEGLPSNRITSLAPDGEHAFWFLTQRGHLGRLEAGRARTLSAPVDARIEMLRLVRAEPAGVIATAVRGGVWGTDGSGPWRQLVEGAGTSGLNILARTATGEIWAAQGAALRRLDDGIPHAVVPLPEVSFALAARAGGGLWVGVGKGLATFVAGRLEPVVIQPPLEEPATAIEATRASEIWIGTEAGLSRLEPGPGGSWTRAAVPLGVARPPRIRALRLDRAGALWVGTLGEGLYRLNRMPVERFEVGAAPGEATALVPDGEGGAWSAGGCRGIFHLDGSGRVEKANLEPLLGPTGGVGCEVSLASASDGGFWLRSRAVLLRVGRSGASRVATDLPAEAGPVVVAPDGTLRVVSRGGRVSAVGPLGERLRERELPGPLVSAAFAPDGVLWIGGEGQLFRIDESGVGHFDVAAGIPRGEVRDLLFRGDGEVWMATYGGGIGRLRAGRVDRITAEQGLPDNGVSRLLEDARGRVWIATNRGLAAVGWRELEAVADGMEPLLRPVVFGVERGFAEANFGSPAGFAGADGRLWFTTIQGAARIDAARFPFVPVPPAVRIAEVSTQEGALALGAGVRIPAGTDRVRFEFSVPGVLYPERMRYRYRIEGVHRDWIDVGPQAFGGWNPARPGDYRLLVEARNEDGIWSAAPAVLELRAAAAWWQTGLFRGSLLVAAAALLLGLVRLRLRAVERRHAERLAILEERRRGEARAAELRAQLEHVARLALAGELATSLAHEVNQPLTAIVSGAQTGRRFLDHYLREPRELEEILDEIAAQGLRASSVIRELRGFLRASDPATARLDLSELVREMLPLVRREVEQHRARLELDLSAGLPPVEASRIQLGQLFVNLLMNACEALSGAGAKREIRVTTRCRAGSVELAVADDGPGIAPGMAQHLFEPFVTTKPEGLGMGLAICRSIAEAHGGRLWLEVPEGGGARFVVALPALTAEAEET